MIDILAPQALKRLLASTNQESMAPEDVAKSRHASDVLAWIEEYTGNF